MNVQVILSEDVPNLGRPGDVVKVRAGYARNYLLPRGLAVEANSKNLRAFEHQKGMAMVRREANKGLALKLKQQLEALALTIGANAGDEGKLFGSVTSIDIERAARARIQYRTAKDNVGGADQAARRVHRSGEARPGG
jgi:large subunit ribosomal protein L9